LAQVIASIEARFILANKNFYYIICRDSQNSNNYILCEHFNMRKALNIGLIVNNVFG